MGGRRTNRLRWEQALGRESRNCKLPWHCIGGFREAGHCKPTTCGPKHAEFGQNRYSPGELGLERGFDTFYGFLGHGGHDYFDLSDTSDRIRAIYRDFAYVHYNAVHNPLQAPEDYVGRFSNRNPKRNTYLAMLAIFDEGVREILDSLDRFELAESTLVIFFSDNGGARGTTVQNGALRDYKHSVYESAGSACRSCCDGRGGFRQGRFRTNP